MLNIEYVGQQSHRSQIPIQVMGAYALRDPKRLKKVDPSLRKNLLGAAEDQMPAPAISETPPPSKKCRTSFENATTVQIGNETQKDELINTLHGLHDSEWRNLSVSNLKYEVDKIKRLTPIGRDST